MYMMDIPAYYSIALFYAIMCMMDIPKYSSIVLFSTSIHILNTHSYDSIASFETIMYKMDIPNYNLKWIIRNGLCQSYTPIQGYLRTEILSSFTINLTDNGKSWEEIL